jgi:hypothetical protein
VRAGAFVVYLQRPICIAMRDENLQASVPVITCSHLPMREPHVDIIIPAGQVWASGKWVGKKREGLRARDTRHSERALAARFSKWLW